MVPTKHVQKCRVRTGYERTLAHMVNRDYAGTAEKDGKITGIDEESRMIEVTYSDGTKDLFEYGEKYTEISGFCISQNLVPVVSVGQKVSKDDLITYNSGFFTYDKYSKQADFSIGNLANVAMMEIDVANEDSTEISTRLSDKLTMYPTNMRVVTLPKNAVIYQSKKIGDHVLNTDELLIYEEAEIDGAVKLQSDDIEAMRLLGEMNRRTPHAKFNGEIVRIDAFYGCDVSEMTDSLATIVKDAIRVTNRRNKISKGTECEFEYPESTKMTDGSKYKGVSFDENTVCLIYYIKETIPHGRGDKLVIGNQMKCTVAGVFPRPIHTESGTEVDLFFSANCAAKRIVLSPIFHGIISRCVEKIEQDAVELYRKEKEKARK